MAKRFTDTNKYKKPFLRSLQGAYKLLWDFLYHECDHAGIWIVDFTVAQIYVGHDMPISYSEAIRFFNSDEIRVVEIKGGEMWFIPSFITFQYGELNDKNRAHLSVITILNKYDLLDSQNKIKPLISPLQGRKDMVMDKDMDMVMDMDKVEGKNFFDEPLENSGFAADRTKFFIPQLMDVWKQEFDDYPEEEEKDYSALNDISKFIKKHEKIPDDPISSAEAAEKIKLIWGAIAKHVASHSFFKKYSLMQVSKHIQSIIQDFRHGKSTGNQTSSDRNLQSAFNKIDQMSD